MTVPKTKTMTPRFTFQPVLEVETKRVRKTLDPVEDYNDREGYDPAFIVKDTPVPLPVLSATLRKDAAKFDAQGKKAFELKYTHFSVVVSASRRMPIYSACNIDGAKAKAVPRTNIWKFDPRIAVEHQILTELYGTQKDGYFSRGHMTRRQDPDWGSQSVAKLADADTFHVTNAAPQVQGFNDGLWGDIEDYILANTRADNMRVSVFTGPVFMDSDPVVHGIAVPVRFWKIVAFVHDETGELAATGYVASQARDVADLKPTFVFGDFAHQQRPLEAIEALSGLKFPELTARDVLSGAGVNFAASLRDVRDIMLG